MRYLFLIDIVLIIFKFNLIQVINLLIENNYKIVNSINFIINFIFIILILLIKYVKYKLDIILN